MSRRKGLIWALVVLGVLTLLLASHQVRLSATTTTTTTRLDAPHASSRPSVWFPPPVKISQLSGVEAKEEMRTLYGIQNFTDCIEPGDLQKKLQQVRQDMPITHGLRYGSLLTIGNRETPTALVVLSPGLTSTAHTWGRHSTYLVERLPHVLFLLPTAPTRSVTFFDQHLVTTAWYDLEGAITADLMLPKRDNTQVRQSVDYLRSLAYTTARRLKVPPQRIVYAGYSQGAAMSLATGLTAAPHAPAGIVCMSGYLAAAFDILQNVVNRATPIVMFHGRQDSVVPLAAAMATRDLLVNEANVTASVELHVDETMGHAMSPAEMEKVANVLARMLPASF